jgi:hypothetical protein
MTTKLEAINTMLSCIGQSPLNTLEGTKSYFTIAAEKILDDETKRVQLTGWDFNTEFDYQLNPDSNGYINITDDLLMVKLESYYMNRYVVRANKLYDKFNHTFKISEPIRASVVFQFEFEDLPKVVREYVKMSAAYKFVKRELGSNNVSVYTQEDLAEARVAMEQHELEVGDYTLIGEFYNGQIKDEL